MQTMNPKIEEPTRR